ncbi:uncharacterized protein [Coffea arabica]|uniref:Uncharacterized protein isoform X1 n=2 Tax=Coffea arabica TaxID=13443 RepID=A0A6P6T3R0_COFAR|nr:uncharacterized protein LOC113694258 isoform X1 [Coffea arabica]XP_027072973.1 uncharacterized protein LOC113697517 isoform X1 [Coffea arabica]
MPRPGPRPYECVRRAWHSDRHQPIRGSIIQRIFKLVYERHGAVTKKNKEWQAKLPIVVLKAEEIMYSKADSEAQYMDLETVWDRVNDAIDTIIRRDESTETGELLPPCVEAALNLGCVPERASRSQRHNNPRTYLSPRTQEGGYAASKVSGGNTDVQNRSLLPPYSGNQSNLERSTGSLEPLVSESNRHLVPNVNSPSTSSSKNLNFPTDSQIAWKDGKASFNVGSVYPLYYGTSFQPDISRLGSQKPHVSKDIIVGRPIFASVEKPAEIGCIRTLLANEANSIAPKQADAGEKMTEEPEVECDLSLRLGPFSNSMLCRGKGTTLVNDKIDPANPSEMGEVKVVSSSSSREKDFSLFSLETTNDPSSFCLGRYNVEGEGRENVETFLRKRKLPFGSSADNRQILWQLKPTPHHFADQMKKQTS